MLYSGNVFLFSFQGKKPKKTIARPLIYMFFLQKTEKIVQIQIETRIFAFLLIRTFLVPQKEQISTESFISYTQLCPTLFLKISFLKIRGIVTEKWKTANRILNCGDFVIKTINFTWPNHTPTTKMISTRGLNYAKALQQLFIKSSKPS